MSICCLTVDTTIGNVFFTGRRKINYLTSSQSLFLGIQIFYLAIIEVANCICTPANKVSLSQSNSPQLQTAWKKLPILLWER